MLIEKSGREKMKEGKIKNIKIIVKNKNIKVIIKHKNKII